VSLNLNLHYDYFPKFGILSRDPYATHDSSDLHVSRIIDAVMGHDIKRVEKTGNLLLWNGCCWEERDNLTPLLDKLADTVKKHINDITKQKFTEPKTFFTKFAEWRHLPMDDEKKLMETLDGLLEIENGIYKKRSTSNSRSQLINMVAARQFIKPENLDRNTDKLVFANGYYDCISGQFAPNDRNQNATICITHDYVEPDQESIDGWSEYLHSLGFDEDTLEYLQRSFGYAATGRGSEKRFWWFRGESNTSKSTLINIIADCLSQYAATTLSKQWLESKNQGSGHTEHLARLRAKRLITSDEFRKNARLDEPLLKKLTSGSGEMDASRKGEKTIEFKITFAIYFASNFDCLLTEDDHAFINRLNSVTFKKEIPEASRDTQFIPKLLAKGKMRMAVLKWVMEGAKKYCESGIGKDPVHIKESRAELMEHQTSIVEQIEEILEKNAGATGKKAVTLNAAQCVQ
jgi:P4 family phage/plasmid primase-like protien